MPNQYTENYEMTKTARIVEFIRRHPDCTSADLKVVFEMPSNRISAVLGRLKSHGEIQSDRPPGARLATWRVVDDSPRQIITKIWTPTVARDPWLWSLFGPARVAA